MRLVINGLAALLLAGCGGVWFESRTRVVSTPSVSVSSTARSEVSVERSVLPGFEAPIVEASWSGDAMDHGVATAAEGQPAAWVSDGATGAMDAGRDDLAHGGSGSESGAGLEARAATPVEGIAAPDGGPTSLTALVGGGVQVDGVVVGFEDLRGLTGLDLGGEVSGRLSTDAAVWAWAELAHDALPAGGGETHVVVRARANPTATRGRAPVRVHLVIDRSSSMQRSWARMLEATRRLVGSLRPEDELHVVAYGSEAVEVVPLGPVGDGSAARSAIGRISVGGGTHIEAGLRMAYDAAARAPARRPGLVVLFSDGVPNHGAFEAGELGALARAAANTQTLTTCAVGLGTQFDERVLRSIARAGGGSYQVADDPDALAPALIARLEARARAAATDLRLSVRLGAGVRVVAVDGEAGAVVDGSRVSLRLPSLDPGEGQRLVVRVRVDASARPVDVARVAIGYRGAAGPVSGARTLSVSMGAEARPRSGSGAASAILDAHLAGALDRVADGATRGDPELAERALLEHAARVEGRREHAAHAGLQARARTARRLAAAVRTLIPASTHAQRRRLALSLGALSADISR